VFLFGFGGIAVTHVVGCAPAVTAGSVPGRATPLPRPEPTPRSPPKPEALAPLPTAEPAVVVPEPFVLDLPERPADAEPGSRFLERAEGLGRSGFDDAVFAAVEKGNVPAYQRKLLPVTVADDSGRKATLHVMCDYLAIGSDDDFIRMPMTSAAAQRIAELTGTILPTKKLVDDIYRQAEAKLPPSYIDGGPTDDWITDFLFHHDKLEKRRKALGYRLGVLTAGNKKDIVLCNRLAEDHDKVAIYGWHKNDEQVIQPLSTLHSCRYADYSHGIRLVDQRVDVDGTEHRLEDMMRDADLASLVSDEGPLAVVAHSKTLPEHVPTSKKKTPQQQPNKKQAKPSAKKR
jgi:hypothetical protein